MTKRTTTRKTRAASKPRKTKPCLNTEAFKASPKAVGHPDSMLQSALLAERFTRADKLAAPSHLNVKTVSSLT